MHDIWSGHQVLAHLDNSVKLQPENVLTYIPVPGDIFYYYRPPNYVRGEPYGSAESAELGIVYAEDTRPQGPRGPRRSTCSPASPSGTGGLRARVRGHDPHGREGS